MNANIHLRPYLIELPAPKFKAARYTQICRVAKISVNWIEYFLNMNSDWAWKTFLLCCTLHCIWLANSFNEGTVAVFRGGGRKCTSEKFLRSNWALDSMASKNYHQFKWKERERGRKGRRLESGRHRREEILKGGRWRCSTLATPRGPACKKLLHHILAFSDTFSASELNK